MLFGKSLLAAMILIAACASIRADENCQTCNEKKPKCDSCEKVKHCGNPVKGFFVKTVGGTIGKGLHQVPCKFEGVYHTVAAGVTPKSDCGCK